MEPLDLREAFTQEKADDSNKMHNNQFSPNNDIGNHWGFTGEDFAEEYVPSGRCSMNNIIPSKPMMSHHFTFTIAYDI